jgi:hypothetical protein
MRTSAGQRARVPLPPRQRGRARGGTEDQSEPHFANEGAELHCGAPIRQDCIETPAKSEVVTICAWQLAGEERLQSTAMIAITREPRRATEFDPAGRMTYRCSVALLAKAGGKTLSYIARASRIRRIRSRSHLEIDRMISPIFRSLRLPQPSQHAMALLPPARSERSA